MYIYLCEKNDLNLNHTLTSCVRVLYMTFTFIYDPLPLLSWRNIFNRHGVVVITTAQLHSTKPELKFCSGSNPARGVSEIWDGEDL